MESLEVLALLIRVSEVENSNNNGDERICEVRDGENQRVKREK